MHSIAFKRFLFKIISRKWLKLLAVNGVLFRSTAHSCSVEWKYKILFSLASNSSPKVKYDANRILYFIYYYYLNWRRRKYQFKFSICKISYSWKCWMWEGRKCLKIKRRPTQTIKRKLLKFVHIFWWIFRIADSQLNNNDHNQKK